MLGGASVGFLHLCLQGEPTVDFFFGLGDAEKGVFLIMFFSWAGIIFFWFGFWIFLD